MHSQLSLFTGAINEHVALVYARWTPSAPGLAISGRVRGPFNQHAHTLPANAPLVECGPGDSLLARAIVTDPCPWSPESPSLYQVTCRVASKTAAVYDGVTTEFGIRRLGVRQRRVQLNGKNWIARGVYVRDVSAIDFAACRATNTTLVARDLPTALLQEAARQGVAVLLDWSDQPLIDRASLHIAASFACVFMVAMGSHHDVPESLANDYPNLILAQRWRRNDAVQPLAQVVWIDETDIVFAPSGPTIFACRTTPAMELVSARQACDDLQATLAPRDQYAGYLVKAL